MTHGTEDGSQNHHSDIFSGKPGKRSRWIIICLNLVLLLILRLYHLYELMQSTGITRGHVILEPWLLFRKIDAITSSCPSPSSQGRCSRTELEIQVRWLFGSHLPGPRRRKDNERRRSDGIQIEIPYTCENFKNIQ